MLIIMSTNNSSNKSTKSVNNTSILGLESNNSANMSATFNNSISTNVSPNVGADVNVAYTTSNANPTPAVAKISNAATTTIAETAATAVISKASNVATTAATTATAVITKASNVAAAVAKAVEGNTHTTMNNANIAFTTTANNSNVGTNSTTVSMHNSTHSNKTADTFYGNDSICTFTLPYYKHDTTKATLLKDIQGWTHTTVTSDATKCSKAQSNDNCCYSHSYLKETAKPACESMCSMRYDAKTPNSDYKSCKNECKYKS